MPTGIEAAYREVAGFAPDQDAVARIVRAGRVLRLQEQDSGWLLLTVLEAQSAAVRQALSGASTLAAAAKASAGEASKAATAVTTAVGNAGPSLARAVQEAAIAVSRDLRASLDQAVGAARKDIAGAIASDAAEVREALRSATESADRRLSGVAADLQAGATGARDRFVADWRDHAAEAATKVLEQRAKEGARRSLMSLLIAGIVAAAVIAVALSFAHNWGWQSGYRVGQADLLTHVHDEKLRASWANTPDGALAYQLYQAGSLRDLATCSGPGWKRQAKDGRTSCLPEATQDGTTYGWFIP